MATFTYNKENEKAYQDILSGYKAQQANYANYASNIGAGYSKMITDNQGVGESDRIALQQQYARNADAAQQSMISRGMGNTTVLDSAQRGVNYDYQNSLIGLNDSIARRNTDLQGAALGFQSQAASTMAGLSGMALDYQGQALGQRYGAEANFVSQYDLANQGAKLGYNTQSQLQQNQANYAMQTMMQGQKNADYMAKTYGYY